MPIADPQKRDVAAVDLVQLGVLGLLLGPDFNDMGIRGGTDVSPLGIGTGAFDGPLLVPSRIPAPWAGGVKVEITVTPDVHAPVPHLLDFAHLVRVDGN
jgi:hypothetical protein